MVRLILLWALALTLMLSTTECFGGEAGVPTRNVEREDVAAPTGIEGGPSGAAASSWDLQDTFDLDRVKHVLAQVVVPPIPSVPAPPEPRHEAAVRLSLREAVDLALKQNLDLQTFSLANQSARLEIAKARARFHPSVGFSVAAGGFTALPEDAARATQGFQRLAPLAAQQLPTGGSLVLSSDFSRSELHPSSQPETFTSTVMVSLIQPLLKGGRIYVATQPIRNAEFDARVANHTLAAQLLTVTAAAKTAYYSVLLSEKVIGVTEAAIERDRQLIDASQSLFEARLVTKRDVFSAELSHAQDSARLVSARADLQLAKNALATVLGLPIGTEVVPTDTEVRFDPIRLDLDRLIATAMARRPEIQAVQEQQAKNRLNIRVARNALLPQLDLVASYGRTHTRSSFGKSLDLEGDVWSAGLVFSYPIGNVGARATLDQAELEDRRLQVALEQTRRAIDFQVRAAIIKLGRSVELIKADTVAIEQAKGKLEVGRAQFALGQATNLDVTDAQQAILNAETDLLGAIVGYNIGLAELEASIGGTLRID